MKSIHETWKVFTKNLCLPIEIFEQVKLCALNSDFPIYKLHKVFAGLTDFEKVIGKSHGLEVSVNFIKVFCEYHKLCKVVSKFYELQKVVGKFYELRKVVCKCY